MIHNTDPNGALEFIKYAYPPNKLRYCGPGNSRAIFDYFQNNKQDEDLIKLLVKFNGAYPNLEFIAHANGIDDPFDARVVDAYWIGNELLNNVSMDGYYKYLTGQAHNDWNKKSFDMLFGESRPFGVKPHHSFHVLSLFTKKKK